MRSRLIEPSTDQILRFCAESTRRARATSRTSPGGARALRGGRRAGCGDLRALCHLGSNLVPSGTGCDAFASLAAKSGARMIIGEAGAVSELWDAARRKLPQPRLDRPGQPVYAISEPPEAGETGLRPATSDDLELLVPACAAAHREELGVDPLRRDPDGFRWRTRAQIEEGRSWLWAEDGVIRFKAEASAWTPAAVQLQQVWTDPPARGQGYAGARCATSSASCSRGRRRCASSCARRTGPRSRLYESVGMQHVLDYRSVLL